MVLLRTCSADLVRCRIRIMRLVTKLSLMLTVSRFHSWSGHVADDHHLAGCMAGIECGLRCAENVRHRGPSATWHSGCHGISKAPQLSRRGLDPESDLDRDFELN